MTQFTQCCELRVNVGIGFEARIEGYRLKT